MKTFDVEMPKRMNRSLIQSLDDLKPYYIGDDKSPWFSTAEVGQLCGFRGACAPVLLGAVRTGRQTVVDDPKHGKLALINSYAMLEIYAAWYRGKSKRPMIDALSYLANLEKSYNQNVVLA